MSNPEASPPGEKRAASANEVEKSRVWPISQTKPFLFHYPSGSDQLSRLIFDKKGLGALCVYMQSYDRRRPNQDPLPDGLEITEQLAYYTNLGRNPRRTASEIPVSKSNVVYIDTRVRAHAVDAKRDEVQARVDKLPKPEQIKIYSELLARLTGEYGNLSDLLPVEQRVSPREWDQYYQKDANNYRQRLIDPGAIPVFGNFGSSSL